VKSIIVSPSLDPSHNVSGISSITQFIISNNQDVNYLHFELGKKDKERGGIFRVKSIINSLIKWNKLLKSHPEAIIHYNFPLSKPAILRDPLFMYIARKRNMKMIIHIHGGNFLTATYTPLYLKWILRKVFSLPVPVIALSKSEKNIINTKFKCDNVFILPNCVDLNIAAKFQKKTNQEKNYLTIGYIGRIAKTKGMDYLLKACKILKEKNIPFILRLAGMEEIPNQYLPIFHKDLKNNFIYDGIVSDEKKTEFLKNLDVFVLPSFFEGLPMSLIECMSYGVVPLTTSVGSISEVVQHDQNGIIIKAKDENSIVEQYLRIYTNRKLLKKLSIEAKRTVFTKFDTFTYIKELNNIYQNA